VGSSVGLGVGSSVGLGVGSSVGLGVGSSVGLGVGPGVGLGVGSVVGTGVGSQVGSELGVSGLELWVGEKVGMLVGASLEGFAVEGLEFVGLGVVGMGVLELLIGIPEREFVGMVVDSGSPTTAFPSVGRCVDMGRCAGATDGFGDETGGVVALAAEDPFPPLGFAAPESLSLDPFPFSVGASVPGGETGWGDSGAEIGWGVRVAGDAVGILSERAATRLAAVGLTVTEPP
jgi:hypothetical protein